MKSLPFFIRAVLLPFELTGQFLVQIVWFIIRFLLSPWGLIAPITLLALLFLFSQLTQTTKMIVANYAQELAFCPETKIPVLINHLRCLEENGIPALVSGLSSPREGVFIACHDAILNEMKRWEQLSSAERIRNYRILSEALLEHVSELGTTGQNETIPIAQTILRHLGTLKATSPFSDTKKIVQNCECFIFLIKKESLKKMTLKNQQKSLDTTISERANENSIYSSQKTTAQTNRWNFDAPLLTAQGEPFPLRGNENNYQNDNLPQPELLTNRAERLNAYYQSPLSQKQQATHLPTLDFVPENDDNNQMLAQKNNDFGSDTPEQIPRQSLLSEVLPSAVSAETVNEKIAQNYLDKKMAIEKEYENEILPDSYFLPEKLMTVPLEKISNLATVRLMQLLQHPDERYVAEARKILIIRDGFQDNHLKLAYRLFHSSPSVRMEIVPMLSSTAGVRSDVWLSVLLGDPNNEVRYRAASFLATANDPAIQRLVIDKGKHDSDARIVNIAGQLLEQQRRKIRR